MDARRAKPSPWIPRLGFAAAGLPLLFLAAEALLGKLGANPISHALNALGLAALQVLLASLACTPLQLAFGWKWPLRLRRMLGLFAYFYACLHFVTYAALDQGLDLGDIGRDIVKRKFITVGLAALLLLTPLAVTSTQKMMKRLGFKRWKLLHRLAYVAALLGAIHFYWRVKKDHTEPLVYIGLLLVLLGVRAFDAARDAVLARRRSAAPKVVPPAM